MLNNLFLGRYKDDKTFIHQLNPITKIISLLIFVLIVFINNNLFLSIILLLFSFYLFWLLKINKYEYISNFKNILIFIVFLVLINLIFQVSLYNTLVMIIELLLLINYSSVFTLSTKPSDITYGLEIILSPLKKINVPVSKVAYSISLSFRFIPIIYEQAIKIIRSQSSRGMDYYHSNIKEKILSLRTMIIPMFILSIKRADALADALDVRNFSFENRIYSSNNIMRLSDYLVIAGHILVLMIIIGVII